MLVGYGIIIIRRFTIVGWMFENISITGIDFVIKSYFLISMADFEVRSEDHHPEV
jgi:hypothetical protein